MTIVRVRFTPNGVPTAGRIQFQLRHDTDTRPLAAGRDILNGRAEWEPVSEEGAEIEVIPSEPGFHCVVRAEPVGHNQANGTFLIPANGPVDFGSLVRYDPKAGMAYEPDPEWWSWAKEIRDLGGVPGETGPEGKTAYQVAVENGFVGTEQAWLESLQGPEGPAGPVASEEEVSTLVTTYVNDKLSEPQSLADGVGEWWIHPLSTHQTSPYSRTLMGGISSTGEVLVSEFNHGTNRTRRVVIGQALVDDHNVPSVIAEPGRRVVASWTNHNNTGPAGESSNSLHVRVGSRSGDIASLANAEPIQVNILEQASYSQWHLIRDLSTVDVSTYWVFVRMGTFSWQIATFEINETTGALTVIRQRRLINTGSRQCYLSTADNYQDPQVIRVGFGFNPAAGDNQVCYLEIDPVSGVVSGADVAANVIANTGLPLAPEDIPPVADLTAETHSRRFFYTRPGPDGPAVAYAEWPKSDPSAAQYFVREFSTSAADEYSGLILGSGYVQSEVMTAYQSQWTQGLEMEFWATLPDTLGVFGARIGTSSNPIVLFQALADGKRRIRVRTDAGVIDNTSSGDWFSTLAGARVGIRVRVDIAAGTCSQWINSTGTWVQIGSTGVNLTAGSTQMFPVSDHRVIVQGPSKVVESVKVSTLAGAEIVGVDFTTDWPAYTNPLTHEGVLWSVENGAYIASNEVAEPVTTTLGASGPSIEPPGAAANARNYIAGAAFESPSYDRAVITASSGAGMETVVKHTPLLGGGWTSGVVKGQLTSNGRLIRPYPPIGGGPVALTVTRMRTYNAFTDYEGDTVIL